MELSFSVTHGRCLALPRAARAEHIGPLLSLRAGAGAGVVHLRAPAGRLAVVDVFVFVLFFVCLFCFQCGGGRVVLEARGHFSLRYSIAVYLL